MNLVDVISMTVILAGAVLLLYRSVWRKNGLCHGCSSGACRSAPRELVRLGQPGRRGAGGAEPPGAGDSRRCSPATELCEHQRLCS